MSCDAFHRKISLILFLISSYIVIYPQIMILCGDNVYAVILKLKDSEVKCCKGIKLTAYKLRILITYLMSH